MNYISSILLGVASVVLACSVNVSAGAGAPNGEETEQEEARPDAEASDTMPPAEPAQAGDGSSKTDMNEVAAVEPPPRKKACSTSEDCGEGMVCEGEGCGEGQGICFSKDRMCTRDLQTYCGCDGVEFQSSGSCPGKRFSARGACPQPS